VSVLKGVRAGVKGGWGKPPTSEYNFRLYSRQFMLVIALCLPCFCRAKINKNFGPPTLRFGPSTLNALAPALKGGQHSSKRNVTKDY